MLSLRSSVLLIGAVLSVLLAIVGGTPAAAESPASAVEGLVDGVYVAPGIGIDAAPMQSVVDRARSEGITMVIVAPSDPQPTTSAYALRVRQLTEADVVLVFGPEGDVEGSVTDDYFDGFTRAENQARLEADPGTAAGRFVDELLREPSGGLPPIVGDLIRVVIGLVAIIGLATVGEYVLRSRRRQRRIDLAAGR